MSSENKEELQKPKLSVQTLDRKDKKKNYESYFISFDKKVLKPPNNIISDTSVVIYNLSSILKIFPTLTTQLTKSTHVIFEIDDEEVPQTHPIGKNIFKLI
jgi:hypothetical protein